MARSPGRRSSEARAQVEAAVKHRDLDRLTVAAPIDGEVLQVNVRPGQYAGRPRRARWSALGDVKTLHVRVDIDENDLAAVRPHARGHRHPARRSGAGSR